MASLATHPRTTYGCAEPQACSWHAATLVLEHATASVRTLNLHHSAQPHLAARCRFKQTGAAAEAADNVFHPLTYEGAVDVAAEGDPVRRRALEAQINEFGQCPRRLFREPHPPRLAAPSGVLRNPVPALQSSALPRGNTMPDWV